MTSASSGSFGKSTGQGPLVGTLDFYEGGDVNIYTMHPGDIDEDVLETFKITVSFILHALNRTDWMHDFFLNHFDEEIIGAVKTPEEKIKSHLTLIKGGKDD